MQERQRFFVTPEIRDGEPLFDVETRDETAGFGMPLNMVDGKVDEDRDVICPWANRRRFEPMPEEVLRQR